MAVIDPIKNPFTVQVTGRIQQIAGVTQQGQEFQSPDLTFGENIELFPGQAGRKVFYQGLELPGVIQEEGTRQFLARSDSPFQTNPTFLSRATFPNIPGQFESSAQVQARLQPAQSLPVGRTERGVPIVAPPPQPGQATTGQPPQQRTLIDIVQSRPDVLSTAQAQGGDPFTAGTPANRWINDWWNTAGKNEFPNVQLVQPTTQQIPPPVQDAPPTTPQGQAPPTTTPTGDQPPTTGQPGAVSGVQGAAPPAEALPNDIYTTSPKPDQTAGRQFTSLRDIYDARPDLQREFPGGTAWPNAANLNQWWNEHGRKEYPNVTLIAPDDPKLSPGLQDDFQTDPIGSFIDLYNRVLEDSGISTVRSQIDLVQKELKDLDADYADDVSGVNENPWLSESLRQKKLNAATGKYDVKRNQLVDQLKLFTGLQEQAASQAKWIASGALGAFQEQQQFDFNQLEALAKMQEVDTQVVTAGGRVQLINTRTGETIRDLGAQLRGGGGGGGIGGVESGGYKFTQNQIQSGTARSGVDIEDFKRFSPEAQNIFINDASSIEQSKKQIDDRLTNGEDPSIIEGDISSSNLPDEIKNYLVSYLWQEAPSPTSTEGWTSKISGWLSTQGFTRQSFGL